VVVAGDEAGDLDPQFPLRRTACRRR
jgi:hypothetical protein